MPSDKNPKLANITTIDPGQKAGEKLTSIFQKALDGAKYDDLGELALTVLNPEDVSEQFNGGTWIEGFDRQQIPHTHQDDGQNASERYLLVFPVGGNGVVDVIKNDGTTPEQIGNGRLNTADKPMERYVFEKGKLSLLKFDGNDLHRFSIMGGKKGQAKGAKLFGVALHTRDVATTMNALVEQTDLFRPDHMPKWDPKYSKHFFPPEEIPQLGDQLSKQIERKLDHVNTALDTVKEGKTGRSIPNDTTGRQVANILSELALSVADQGVSYGNKEAFGDINSLRNWRDASVQKASASTQKH